MNEELILNESDYLVDEKLTNWLKHGQYMTSIEMEENRLSYNLYEKIGLLYISIIPVMLIGVAAQKFHWISQLVEVWGRVWHSN